jgi:hypothetical protein
MPRNVSPAAKKLVLRELQRMPNIGASTALDLWDLGIRKQDDLKRRDPQAMYDELMAQRGAYIDRCQLYVFRAAVYYAETSQPAPELVQWWKWSDKALLARGIPAGLAPSRRRRAP